MPVWNLRLANAAAAGAGLALRHEALALGRRSRHRSRRSLLDRNALLLLSRFAFRLLIVWTLHALLLPELRLVAVTGHVLT
jgi:hypothetical protein